MQNLEETLNVAFLFAMSTSQPLAWAILDQFYLPFLQ